ncbi:MAG: ATP-binding cassette domain-containing protein [Propionibacteriales bacterium]|nr:ATP-binding cassette domain-containing protein [Propionibacteriales bacterium]
MGEFLTARGIGKRYGDFWAVRGVDLELPEGRLTSVIGPNGAGKTTLINLLSGLVRADEGRITFRGEDITRLPIHKRVRRGISRSFQITSVFPQLTVRDNILLPVLARRGETAAPFRRIGAGLDGVREAQTVLERVGLSEQQDLLAGVLPHGDQRLLEIAMALAPEPSLCFLDEPCTGMTPGESQQILRLVRRLGAGQQTTFVVVEHDMDVVFSISDWIIVMNRGEVLVAGPPDEIRNDAAVREVYLGEEVQE